MLGKDSPGPELRGKYDNPDNDHQQGYKHRISLPSPLSDEVLKEGTRPTRLWDSTPSSPTLTQGMNRVSGAVYFFLLALDQVALRE
jgi:hypothetical protein